MFILFILALSKEQLNQGAEQFYLWVPDIDEVYLHSFSPLLFYTPRARIKAAVIILIRICEGIINKETPNNDLNGRIHNNMHIKTGYYLGAAFILE